MGIKRLYNDNLRKLPNEYRDVSVMTSFSRNFQLLCITEKSEFLNESPNVTTKITECHNEKMKV